METWFHSSYRARIETLDAKHNLILPLFELVWPHEVKPRLHSWYRGRQMLYFLMGKDMVERALIDLLRVK